jgi:hypothetical protein
VKCRSPFRASRIVRASNAREPNHDGLKPDLQLCNVKCRSPFRASNVRASNAREPNHDGLKPDLHAVFSQYTKTFLSYPYYAIFYNLDIKCE